jgi:hypothetical protein
MDATRQAGQVVRLRRILLRRNFLERPQKTRNPLITASKTVDIEPSPFAFGDTHGVVTGWVKPADQPGTRRYAFDIATKGAVVAGASGEPPPVADRVGIAGNLDLSTNLITITMPQSRRRPDRSWRQVALGSAALRQC